MGRIYGDNMFTACGDRICNFCKCLGDRIYSDIMFVLTEHKVFMKTEYITFVVTIYTASVVREYVTFVVREYS